jgi:hypothetical protein
MEVDDKIIIMMKQRIDHAFMEMNTYAKDPYNMGGDAQLQSRILPTDILANVYMELAPVSAALTEIMIDHHSDRCLICGAKKATHKDTHLCRMHTCKEGYCTECGKARL